MGRARGVNKTNNPSESAWQKKPKPQIDKPSRGIGDTVEKIIHKVSGGRVKSCGGCKKRQDALNKLIPYKGCTNCQKEEDPPPTT